MAALLPTLVSAIMGSNRNKGFDPKDPNSKPYDERTTGMGRFLQRFGSGVDTGELNNEYAAKRYADERNFEQQSALQKAGQDFQSQLTDKQNKESWNRQHSRLTNDAEMETIRQGFQSRLLSERNNEDARRERLREMQRNYEETGSYDPMEQQAIKKKMIDQKLNDPIRLGAGAYIDRGSGMTHYIDPGSGPGFDLGSGDLTPSTPRGWRTYDPNNPAPSSGAAPQPGAGRSLGNPEEIRNALGVKLKTQPSTPIGGGGAGMNPQSGTAENMIQAAPAKTPTLLDSLRNHDWASDFEGVGGVQSREALGDLGSAAKQVGSQGLETGKQFMSEFLKRIGINIPVGQPQGGDIVSQLIEKQRRERGSRGVSGGY